MKLNDTIRQELLVHRHYKSARWLYVYKDGWIYRCFPTPDFYDEDDETNGLSFLIRDRVQEDLELWAVLKKAREEYEATHSPFIYKVRGNTLALDDLRKELYHS